MSKKWVMSAEEYERWKKSQDADPAYQAFIERHCIDIEPREMTEKEFYELRERYAQRWKERRDGSVNTEPRSLPEEGPS